MFGHNIKRLRFNVLPSGLLAHVLCLQSTRESRRPRPQIKEAAGTLGRTGRQGHSTPARQPPPTGESVLSRRLAVRARPSAGVGSLRGILFMEGTGPLGGARREEHITPARRLPPPGKSLLLRRCVVPARPLAGASQL
jgi:hypothetical protein